MTDHCLSTLRLHDTLTPRGGVPVQCVYNHGHVGTHYGTTETGAVIQWRFAS